MTDTAAYRLDVYNTSEVLQAILTDFAYLAYRRQVNHPGVIQFGLKGDHALLATLADKWQVEAWRKPSGGTWVREITGLYRMGTWSHSDASRVGIFCNGLMSIIGWRHVAWTAGYANRSTFASVAAETIANTLVKYNATSDATVANGRKREGAITGLTVEADGAAGSTVDWNCAYDNLLTTLQELCKIGGGDFDLVKTSSTAWQWRWYTGQLGTDRTASVTFAMNYGNMANPVYMENHTGEKTVAIVGGQGEGADRTIVIRTGTDYVATSHDFEMFVSATDLSTTDALNSPGDVKLAEAEVQKQFTFSVLQTPACEYGTHYVLGDLVTAVNPFTEATVTLKVDAVNVTVKDDGSEIIDVELVNP